jgi:hypothetical protein
LARKLRTEVNYAFSFGGVWRADLTNKFPGRTKGMGLMVARGALTAQERSDARTLLTR